MICPECSVIVLRGSLDHTSSAMRAFWVFWLLLAVMWAEEAQPQLKELISRLNADAFAQRKSATVALEKWALDHPKRAMEELPVYLRGDLDPETAARIRKVLQELFLKRQLAFFGINFGLQPNQKFQGKMVCGVMIRSIVPDGPSDRGGLLKGDLILALNNIPFPPSTEMEDVIARVGTLSLKEKVRVHIQRKQKIIVVRMRPGIRPVPSDLLNQKAERANRLRVFNRWLEKQLAK